VDATIDIPIEVQARIEANAFFEALRAGDYASAAEAQERLRAIGWHISREVPRQTRKRRVVSR
jgi:hypothetical protein